MNVKGFLSVFFFFTLPSMAWAQAVGDEFQVNTHTTSQQGNAAVATDADGDFVVVWDSWYEDNDQRGVFGQRFDATATAQGTEFQVNTFTTSHQSHPSVAMNTTSGDFVVVWTSEGQDDDYRGIFGQRYNAAGTQQGGEFQVNSSDYSYFDQYEAATAMAGNGNFVVVWQSKYQDGDGGGVFGRVFDSSGGIVVDEFPVNTYVTGFQKSPSVAADASGNFVVVWQDFPRLDVFGQLFDSSGIPQGGEFLVNTYTTGSQVAPQVAMDADGNFVVVWQDSRPSGNDIFGQLFDASGTAQGGEFLVTTYTTGSQFAPQISMNANGDFVVLWEDDSDRDGDGEGEFAQRFDASGTAQGSDFQVNEYTTDDQYGGKVALDPNGNFVVVWQSRQDGSAYGVFGRRFPSSVPVEVLLQDLIDFVTGLHPADFSKPIYQNALLNKLDALWVLIDSGDLSTTCQAIDKLQNDIIKKVDSVTPPPDWLIPGDARDEIYNKAVALVLALKGQADTLGGCP